MGANLDPLADQEILDSNLHFSVTPLANQWSLFSQNIFLISWTFASQFTLHVATNVPDNIKPFVARFSPPTTSDQLNAGKMGKLPM